MKRKLTSCILAIAVMASLSLPAFAADCRTTQTEICPSGVLLQLLLQYGSCGQSGTQMDWETLLRALLTPPVTPEQPTVQETPSQQETPAKPEQPEAPAEPSAPETPIKPETPAKPEQPATPANTSVSAYEQEVARLVNAERAKEGLAPLTLSAELSRVARMKSQDMHDRGYFDHNSPTYGSPFQLMKSQGITYRTAGENIAMGYRTPEAVVNAWMNSPGHRANILNASYTTIGVGYVADGSYWTQHFIG